MKKCNCWPPCEGPCESPLNEDQENAELKDKLPPEWDQLRYDMWKAKCEEMQAAIAEVVGAVDITKGHIKKLKEFLPKAEK